LHRMWFVPVFLKNSNCLNSNLDRNIGGRSSQGHLLFFKRLSFGFVLTHRNFMICMRIFVTSLLLF